ncbi:DUF4169 family protein [Camelimonas abortus]|uniref:DUF4169 family protein n=1 Tax=Camelimonas abortus TaxID=1017184 RepID=A0ABV7LGS7_9HYPH
MGDVINFRQARKSLARRNKEEAAARNRAVHGRSKAQKERDAAVTSLAERRLEAHRRDHRADDDDTGASA